jgi:hypothetical protein
VGLADGEGDFLCIRLPLNLDPQFGWLAGHETISQLFLGLAAEFPVLTLRHRNGHLHARVFEVSGDMPFSK